MTQDPEEDPKVKAFEALPLLRRHFVLDMEAGEVVVATTRRDPMTGLTLTRPRAVGLTTEH